MFHLNSKRKKYHAKRADCGEMGQSSEKLAAKGVILVFQNQCKKHDAFRYKALIHNVLTFCIQIFREKLVKVCEMSEKCAKSSSDLTIITYPVSRAEVDCFSKIISLVETSMVGTWECHNKLPCALICSDKLQVKLHCQ